MIVACMLESLIKSLIDMNRASHSSCILDEVRVAIVCIWVI